MSDAKVWLRLLSVTLQASSGFRDAQIAYRLEGKARPGHVSRDVGRWQPRPIQLQLPPLGVGRSVGLPDTIVNRELERVRGSRSRDARHTLAKLPAPFYQRERPGYICRRAVCLFLAWRLGRAWQVQGGERFPRPARL